MARIDSLNNFLTDVANAIRSKTSNDYPIQPENYDTEIESIQGGMEIQNGTIANYKATTTTVPAGTFVKLNTSYESITASSTGGFYATSAEMGNNLFMNMITSLTNYNYYSTVRIFQVTPSGIIKKAEATNTGIPYSKSYGFGIDSEHFIIFSLDNNDNQYYYKGTYQAGSLSITNSGNITNSVRLSTNCSGIPTSYLKTEDENNIYIHLFKSFYNSNVSATYYGSGIVCATINKNTYGVTFNSGISADGSLANYKKYVCTNAYDLGNNKFIGTRYSNEGIIVFTFDTQTKTYTAVNSTGDSLNAYGDKKGYFTVLNNTLYFIYAYSSTVLHYAKLEFNDNTNKVTLVEDAELFNSNISVFSSLAGYQIKPDNNTLLLGLRAGNNSYGLVIRADSNGIRTGTLLQLNTENVVPSSPETLYYKPFDICDGNIICQALTTNDSTNGYQSIPIKMCLCTIDDYLNVNQATGSAITVQTTTGIIQGLTKTDCTTTISGEVYLLDTSS